MMIQFRSAWRSWLSIFLTALIFLSLLPVFPASAKKKTSSLELSKTVSPTVQVAGGTVSYTITVVNSGNANATYYLTDTLPSGFTYVAATAKRNGVAVGPDPTQTGNVLRLPKANNTVTINSGTTDTWTFNAVLSGGLGTGAYDNNASLTCTSDSSQDSDTGPTATVSVGSPPVLSISKSASPTAVPLSTGITTYSVIVQNIGQGASQAVTIVDTLPATFSYRANTSKLNGVACANPTVSGSTLTWTSLVASLASNGAFTLTFDVNCGATNGTFSNLAAASSPNASPVDTGLVAPVRVGTAGTLSISKSVTGTPVNPGGTVTYSITVTNTGTVKLTNLVVGDDLPQEIGWAYQRGTAKINGTKRDPDEGGNYLEWQSAAELASLAPGASLSVTGIQVKVPLDQAGTFNNVAYASADNAALVSTGPVAPVLINGPHFTIAKEAISDQPAGAAPVASASAFTSVLVNQTVNFRYRITVTNDGNAAGQYRITDTLPTGVTCPAPNISHTGGGGIAVAVSGQTLEIDSNTTIGTGAITLNAGATDVIVFTCRMTETTPGVYYNSATVVDTGAPTVNSATADTGQTAGVTAGSSPNLTVAKTVSASNVYPLSVVTYTITVTNLASSTTNATGVGVTDTLPTGFTYQPGTSLLSVNGGPPTNPGNPSGSSGTITWSNLVASLAPNKAFTLTFSVQVSSLAGVYDNNATVSGTNFYAIATGPCATVIVSMAPALTISKTGATSGGFVTIGPGTGRNLPQDVIYTITVSNGAAAATANGISITDVLANASPGKITCKAGTSKKDGASIGDPNISSQTLTWSGLGSLAAGQSMTLQFTATFANSPGTIPNGTYTDTASVSGANFTTVSSGPTAPITVGTPPVMALTQTVSPATIPADGVTRATYTVKLTNTGGAKADPIFTAILPDNMSYVANSTTWAVAGGTPSAAGNPTGTTGTITWSYTAAGDAIGFTAPNNTGTLTFQVVVASGAVAANYYVETSAYGDNWAQLTSGPPPGGSSNIPPLSVTSASAILLRNFSATSRPDQVRLQWQTGAEWSNLGFHVYRAESENGPWIKVSAGSLTGLGTSGSGGTYSVMDADVEAGRTYYYQLEDVEFGGMTRRHGPLRVSVPTSGESLAELPLAGSEASGPTPTAPPPVATTPKTADTMQYVTVEAIDDTGMTLRLRTPAVRVVSDGGNQLATIDKLSLISTEGLPQLPEAVIPVAVPADTAYTVSVLDQLDPVTIADFRPRINTSPDVATPLFRPAAMPSLQPSLPPATPPAAVPAPPVSRPGSVPAAGSAKGADSGLTAARTTLQGSSLQFAFSVLGAESFPAELAEVAASAQIRDHRIVKLKLYPVQYNRQTQTLTQYRDLRVRLAFQTPATLVDSQSQTGAFDKAFDQLLAEYDLLHRWKAPIAPLPNTHVALGGPAFRLVAPGEGLYQLTGDQLRQAGVRLDEPEFLRLFCRGRELPLDVAVTAGEVSGIRFFAPKNETIYSDETTLFLVNDTVAGLRMTRFDATPQPEAGVAAAHAATIPQADRNYWWRQMPNDGASGFWFQDYLDLAFGNRPESLFAFTLSDPAGTEDGSLTVRLRGEVNDPNVYLNNHVAVDVNGARVGDVLWHGNLAQRREMAVPASALVNGQNTVRLTLMTDRGAAVPVALVESVDLTYWRRFTAQSGRWTATLDHPGSRSYEVTGFAQPILGVYDVTDPWQVRRADHADLSPSAVRFADPAPAAKARYWVCDATGVQVPAIAPYQPAADLRDGNQQADYLVITPEAFRPAAEKLAAFRSNQGLQTRAIPVQAIYDQFAGGHAEPEAIKAFLTWAVHNWRSPAPSYVVLLGDGSFDYRNDYRASAETLTNFIPPHLSYSRGIGLIADDNWYACVVGDDDLPDLFIGRLPADGADEATAMVDKIIGYELRADAPWRRNALTVTDDKDSRFGQMSQDVATRYGGLFTWTSLGVHDQRRLLDQLDAGSALTLYVGHGGIDIWADEAVLSADPAVGLLQNTDRPGVVVAANCLTGYFQDPDFLSLGEALLKPAHKGAVGYVSANGYTSPAAQALLLKRFFRHALDGKLSIGAALTMAKIGLFMDETPLWQEENASWLVLGDPATALRQAPSL